MMRRAKTPKSIFFTVFIAFFSVLILFVVFFSATNYRNVSKQVSSLVYSALKTNVDSISDSVDQNINEMDKISSTILHSNDFTEGIDFLFTQYDAPVFYPEDYEFSHLISKMREDLLKMTGIGGGADQINIMLSDGKMLASGLHNNLYTVTVDSWEERKMVEEAQEEQVIFFSGKNSYLSRYYLSPVGQGFISFVQLHEDNEKQQAMVIDVKKSVTRIAQEAINYQSLYGESVYLFDSYDNQIYPVQSSRDKKTTGHNYYELVKNHPPTTSLLNYRGTQGKQYITFNYSPYTGIYTVIALDESYLTSTTLAHYMQFIPLTILLLLFAGFLSLLIAKFISQPINHIYGYIKAHDFLNDDFYLPNSTSTNILEVNTLIKSFNLMQEKLHEAKDIQMELQKREMQSLMLSLQAQMNPHFLYNSLATIQAMADEGMNDEIATMCRTTSRILRYISTDKEAMVPLEKEIAHTKDYLECMRIRYDGDLDYLVDIPKEMRNIDIPKLCVQLLVENSVKFTTEKRPPWKVTIRGTLDYAINEKYWYLSVRDNGPGFTDEKLKEIKAQISLIDHTGLLPSLELKGMGLLNVYIRLKLSYGDSLIFNIDNRTFSGAEVLIGGKYV